MSYDINFWKQERKLSLSPEEIYQKLSGGEAVEGLERLPVEQILKKLKEVFPDFDPGEKFSTVRTSEGSIEFSWSDQHFRFDIRGICGECQKLVDVMREFGCPMYDPQENKRYDSEGGVGMGNAPGFSSDAGKRGCGMMVMLLILIFVVVAAVIWKIVI